MDIDFTGVSAARIPEGNVTKITVKDTGVVKWEKVSSVIVKITSAGDASNGYFSVSGTKYYAVGTYQFDVGAVLSFKVYGGDVTLNGKTVSSTGASGYRTYKLTVAPDYSSVDIAFTSASIMWNATITTNT